MKRQATDKSSSAPHSSTEQKANEQVTTSVATQAQRLVDELGSADLAKHAVEAVGAAISRNTDGPGNEVEGAFAKAMGFPSFSKLLAASQQVESNDGVDWRLTSLPDGTWAAWNSMQLHLDRHYASREEALANVPHDAEFSGSSTLG